MQNIAKGEDSKTVFHIKGVKNLIAYYELQEMMEIELIQVLRDNKECHHIRLCWFRCTINGTVCEG